MTTFRFFAAALISGAFLFCTNAEAQSLRVQPMSYDLEPAGSHATQDIRVENVGDRAVPVEVRIVRRHINPDGTERQIPAEDDFIVFPPQGLVQPGSFQTFRARYIGAPLQQSALYLITIAQLPINVEGGGENGVQFLFNLGTSAIVSPPRAEPRLVVESVAPSPEAGKLRITIRNDGNRYARLHNGVWTFASAGRTERLEGQPLRTAVNQPLIEPGTRRTIDLPVPANFRREGATASFEFIALGAQ